MTWIIGRGRSILRNCSRSSPHRRPGPGWAARRGVIRPAPGQPSLAGLAAARSCATWFFLIAVLSVINSIAAFSGGGFRFIFGLGLTQIFDYFGRSLGGSRGLALALVLDLLATGLFVLLGVLARKGLVAAILTGIVLLLLDSLVFFWLRDWIGVAFHAYVLFRLFMGFQASRGGRG
jgi:hypothetical protein